MKTSWAGKIPKCRPAKTINLFRLRTFNLRREICHCHFLGLTVEPTREFDTARLLQLSKAHQLKPEDYAVLDVCNLTELDARIPVGAPLVPLMGGPSPEKLSYLSEIRELEKGIAKSHPDMVNHKETDSPNKTIDSEEE